ncbi:hypothetical protein X727_02635 [Mesorhizobium sp. L103C119B0]|nr:hypothetical protein X768_22315 [Mesorhizobium sp. LSJC265A00]ESX66322.1 hypothetical protein X757_31585 [Mesorhizobium sp. LSHC414A00]ESY00483.1 hypothetical protein X755_07240 [Mesorhizobium sp. LNJC405B00]ESY14983.1 hypothetical protein X750_29540 [Mesorhizobium sp. LNJC394B00]ESZ73736.1 hypothetical protein X727_02635 [Mesorhizobium sp. L103C119B0]
MPYFVRIEAGEVFDQEASSASASSPSSMMAQGKGSPSPRSSASDFAAK